MRAAGTFLERVPFQKYKQARGGFLPSRSPSPGTIIPAAVPRNLAHHEPQRDFYRDLDGQIVRLIKVDRNLCTWVAVGSGDAVKQVTHHDNFVRRFTPVRNAGNKTAA
ncbi:MAG TPA: hypothetical protein VFI82_07690 [Terriglobales bacterium]|jgi:hypothetical protein|nr:hypothetical protein [Terriglobales bacterium]